MTISELKLSRMEAMISEWELKLRSKSKYSEADPKNWEEVREMYYDIRNDHLQIDLMDEELNTSDEDRI